MEVADASNNVGRDFADPALNVLPGIVDDWTIPAQIPEGPEAMHSVCW